MYKFYCSQCEHALDEFEEYSVIQGELYCRECAIEWAKDEIYERFEDYWDQISEMIGIPVLEAVYG